MTTFSGVMAWEETAVAHGEPTRKIRPCQERRRRLQRDSVKRHLPIEYPADLTPVVAGKEAGASWNLAGWQKPLDFSRRKEYGVRASGRHPEKLSDTTKARRGGGINWYWAKQRGTSRLNAWPVHERCRIFGGHGCGLGGGRRLRTGYRQETGSWSAPPEPWFGERRGV
jgi:hypothetical protein